jgi:hypothetical protein
MSDTECDTNPETTDGPGDEPTDAEVSAEIGNIFNEIVLLSLSGTRKSADQAKALDLPSQRLAELRRTAKRLLEDLLKQREGTR